MAHQFLGHSRIRIGVLADRGQTAFAGPAAAAGDGKRDDDTITDLQRAHRRSGLDHLAHELVAEDVALAHGRDETVVEMQIRTADGSGGDLHDRVPSVEDLGIRDVLYFYVGLAHPNGSSHPGAPIL
jgi:hypothetical protein